MNQFDMEDRYSVPGFMCRRAKSKRAYWIHLAQPLLSTKHLQLPCKTKIVGPISIIAITLFLIAGIVGVLTLQSNLPYTKNIREESCGVIVNYHINKCAGGSIQKWYKNQAGTENYLQLYENPRVKDVFTASKSWKNDVEKVNNFLQNLTSNSWKVLEIHHGFPGMFYTQDIFATWENLTKEKGCRFVRTVIIRDPLDRFMSNFVANQVRPRLMFEFAVSRANWLTRYILFNICGTYEGDVWCGYDFRDTFTMTPQFNSTLHEKSLVKIINSFDIIGFKEDIPSFLRAIEEITGWQRNDKIGHWHKSYASDLQIPRELLQTFIKLNKRDYQLYYKLSEVAMK